MNDAKPSLVRRALAVLVLVVVAIIAFRLLLGVISAVFWIVALVAVLVAGLWAWSTLRSAKRGRSEKRERTVEPSPAAAVTARPQEDRVEAEMLKLKQQLRDQGRL